MSAPTLVVMTPLAGPAGGPPAPLAAQTAMDQTATLLAHWRAHGWPVAQIGAPGGGGWPVPVAAPEDVTPKGGPLVLAGALSGDALIASAEIAHDLGLSLYVPEESLAALGVSATQTGAARELSARILPLADVFAAVRDAAVRVV